MFNINQEIRNKPYEFLFTALDVFENIYGNTIVEIGSMRKDCDHHPSEHHHECCNDGHSTLILASNCKDFHTVDIDPSHSAIAKQNLEKHNIKGNVHTQDGIQYLKDFDGKIDLLFLDAWDVCVVPDYAEKHLEAFKAAEDKLAEHAIILIDDTDISYSNEKGFHNDEECLGGKGRELIPYLKKKGYTLYFKGRQTCFIKNDFINGNKFKELADVIIDETTKSVVIPDKDELIFFIKTDQQFLDAFKNKILPTLNKPFTIITHNSDCPVDNKNLDLLDHPDLVKWYGMNCHIKHYKLTPIPIGIANTEWPHGNIVDLLKVIYKTNVKDVNSVYCNFDVTTNPYRRDVTKQLMDKKFITFESGTKSPIDYWDTLSTYEYVISPPGNSIDCHRVWEAIYLGVIPIIEKDLAMESFYSLPIMIIDNWFNLQERDLFGPWGHLRRESKFSYYKDMIEGNYV